MSQWTTDANEVSVDEALPTNSRHGNSSIAWPSEADEPLQPPAAPPAKPKTVAKAAEILAKHSVVATSEVSSASKQIIRNPTETDWCWRIFVNRLFCISLLSYFNLFPHCLLRLLLSSVAVLPSVPLLHLSTCVCLSVCLNQARGVPEAATTKKRDLASRLGAKPGAATANAATITTAARQGQSLPSSSSSAAAHPPKKARGVQDSTSSKASAAPVEAKPVDVSAVKVKSFAELMAEKRAAAAAASGAGAGSAPASVVESNTIGSSKNNNGSSRNAAAKETNTSAGESEARMENNHTEEKNEATASSSAEADAGDDAALPGSSSSFHIGQRVVAQFGGVGGEWFPGTVAARHDADNTYDVAYDDGDAESQKPADQLVDAAALGV